MRIQNGKTGRPDRLADITDIGNENAGDSDPERKLLETNDRFTFCLGYECHHT